LNIDGLDCTRVNKIEPLSVKQKITTNSLGETNIYGIEPTGLELPHLVITLPESHAEAFYKWEEDFLLRGNCSAECEKTATLFYLTPDLKDVLFSISMANIGIFKLTADKLDAGSESLRRVKAEMYVEEFTFNFENGATWA
jgi:hypothetical protein